MKLSSVTYLLMLLILAVFFTGCEKKIESNSIVCNLDDYSLYPKIIETVLPTYTVKQSENQAYYSLGGENISEAFDTQAVGALETGIAKHWYPHYLATVIIAIDRDQTNALVTTWSDLLDIKEEVAFSNTPVNVQMITGAISYGLEGSDYTLKSTVKLLTSLYDKNRLKTSLSNSPIIICYDYQAAAMIEEGANIEIIVPTQGTLTYEKGLLSNENLQFDENIDKLLLQSKFRLLDGKSDGAIYPDKTAYTPAVKLTDYEHFAKATRKVVPIIDRKVLNSRRFMSIDYREHLYFALMYMCIVTIWVASVLRRSMQKGISYAAFSTGVILNGWALVRLIKYQLVVNELLSRYLWYSYYIFQLSLPLIILWMAWAIDKPKSETFPPKWWRVLAVFVFSLIILVFTNDLHGLVFKLDLSRPDWGDNYSYGIGYYLVFSVCMINIASAFIIMLKKALRSPRKKRFIFPLGVFILFGIYNYKYIMRDTFVYETDLTIITGIFVMLMFEASIQSGLIPVNTKYIDIFKRSPLKIQILNKERQVALSSALASDINKDNIEKVIISSPKPILQEDESLLFANDISGGYALWSQDVSKIQKLHREILQSTKKLTEANKLLAEEEKIKRIINQKNAKKDLMDQLQTEIAENIEKISNMIGKLEISQDHLIDTARIALLLCYTKRRCNLFFKEKELKTIQVDELILHIDELCDIGKYSNVNIATTNEVKGNLSIRFATLFYDFFYSVTDLAIKKYCPYIIVNIAYDDEWIVMRMLPSLDIG